MGFSLRGALSGALSGALVGLSYGPLTAIVGGVIGFVAGGFLLSGLLSIPKLPDGVERTGKQYDVDLQQNSAQLGDVKSIVIGRCRDWPNYRAQPYKENIDHDEVIHAYLHLSVGDVDVHEIKIGDSPLESFAGYDYQIMRPGEPMTLFHPNVYTNPEVEGIDLEPGAVGISITKDFRFLGQRIIVENSTALAGINEGEVFTVTGSGSNDGTYTAVASGQQRGNVALYHANPNIWVSYVEIASTFVDEEVNCTITVDQVANDAVTIETERYDVDGDPVELRFDPDVAEIRVTDAEKWAGWFEKLRVGDIIGVRNTDAGENEDVDFEILSTDGASVLRVTPPPDEATTPATLFLKRRYEGPYYAAPPGEVAEGLGIDITFDALGRVSGSGIKHASVAFHVRWRPVDAAGLPLGSWETRVISYSDNKLKKRRFTEYIPLDPPMRPQVQVARLTIDKGESTVYDDAQWNGLRGYLQPRDSDDAPNVDETSTTLAVRIRASGQLNAVSQRKINVIETKHWPVYDPDTDTWTEQPTRNPAWNAIGWLVSQSAGQLSYADFDLPKWVAFAAGCDDRGDQADGIVNSERQLWPTAQAIMRVARAKVHKNPLTGLLEPYRDESVPPTLMLCDGLNAKFGPDKINTPDANTVTGVRVSFTDPDLWRERRGADAPLAGNEEDPRDVQFEFCTSWQAAYREAWYEWMDLRYRTQTLSVDAEMEGLLAKLGTRVLLASNAKGWGQVAELRAATGRLLEVWPAPMWADGAQHYVYLQDPEGRPGARINCTRGADDGQIVLNDDPDVELRTGEFPTLIAFGNDEAGEVPECAPRVAVVMGGTPRSMREASLDLVLDDPRVHEDPPVIPPDPYDMSIEGFDPTIRYLQVRRTVYPKPPDSRYVIGVDWDPIAAPDGDVTHELYWRPVGSSDTAWTLADRGPGNSAELVSTEDVTDIQLRVRVLSGPHVGPYAYATWPVPGFNVIVTPRVIDEAGPSDTLSAAVVVQSVGGASYHWVKDSGGAITIDDATSTTPTFTASGLGIGETREAVWHCAVTVGGATKDSVPVRMTFTRTP